MRINRPRIFSEEAHEEAVRRIVAMTREEWLEFERLVDADPGPWPSAIKLPWQDDSPVPLNGSGRKDPAKG